MLSFTDGKMYIQNHIRDPSSSKHENTVQQMKESKNLSPRSIDRISDRLEL